MDKIKEFIKKNKIERSFYKSEGLENLINCNDFFAWACADCEEVKEEDLPDLQRAIDDVIEAAGEDGRSWGTNLWVCRKREMRPQGAFYPGMPEAVRTFFNTAGPEREVNFFNPQNQDGVMYPPEYVDDDEDDE